MKKRIAAGMLLLFLFAAMTGCGEKGGIKRSEERRVGKECRL